MEEPLTISKKLPELTSMQYETLREAGIRHIQELAGKLWTNYNTHDPGITMLEAMSYVITDLGYRVNQDIRDILTTAGNDPEAQDIKNFYTACQILPSCPVTSNDFRKLIIDVEVADHTEDDCTYAGVKNAWIQKAPDAEQRIYVDNKSSLLSLNPVPMGAKQDHYFVKGLFDILLEFDKCDKYGDLNANTMEGDKEIDRHDPDPNMEGVIFNIKITFPRWDDQNVDWDNPVSVQSHIDNINVNIYHLPDNYELQASISNSNEVILSSSKDTGGTISEIAGLAEIIQKINNFIYAPADGLLYLYLEKVRKIKEIVAQVKRVLHANRNLCHDYYRFSALKVEEIMLCADIEIDPAVEVAQVHAQIYHGIAKFLSPQVIFYTLEEMLDQCLRAKQYTLEAIGTTKRIFTINQKLEEDLNGDDLITIMDSGEIDGTYTVKCTGQNKDNPDHTDIEVLEEISSDNFAAGAYLFKGTIEDTICMTVDKIFEGPKLRHGFINDDELSASGRLDVIRVSDLIRIIMDVEGVLAVRHIQLANRPQDNNDDIESVDVKWCLELATEKNYVPRLNLEDSKITLFKDQLPYQADRAEVRDIVNVLEKSERPQKIRYPMMDIPVPAGTFVDTGAYTSLQEDLPPVYGVGAEGIPGLESLPEEEKIIRRTEVRQLKGFLLFFDQLMANYLSQLAHVKDLFSMNGDKDESGNYLVDKTYFSQPLYDIIPDADPLYIDRAGHEAALQEIVESRKLFEERRNKFLDHLLGRFAETFTDYTLLSYKISGTRAPAELMEDKLNFLNRYPDLSKSRGKGFNYLEPCRNWHMDNISGLEKRVSLLTGIAPRSPETLAFRENFEIQPPAGEGEPFKIEISDDADNTLMTADPFETEADSLEHIELIILNGVCKDNYQIVANEGSGFRFNLQCGNQLLATSSKTDYASADPGDDADLTIEEVIRIFEREYYTNPESNRKDLACPLFNYFVYNVTADMAPVDPNPPAFTITYTLNSKAFSTDPGDALLEGSVTGEAGLGDTEDQVLAKGEDAVHQALWAVVNNGMSRDQYVLDTDETGDNPSYSFIISNSRGDQIAKSVDNDPQENGPDEGPAGEEAIAQTMSFIEAKFFSHEGMHVIEHVLLRPRVNEKLFVAASEATLSEGLAEPGKLFFHKTVPVVAASVQESAFTVAGDLSGEIATNKIRIEGGSFNDGTYKIAAIRVDGSQTIITTQRSETPVLFDLPEAPYPNGMFVFIKETPITDIDAPNYKIIVADGDAAKVTENDIIQITGSTDGLNDNRYKVAHATGLNGNVEIVIFEAEQLIRDTLLPVHLNHECDTCKQKDPYSSVASVVLPYWPGRFINFDFRKFMDKTLRLEAPAQVMLNICWVDCRHMAEFEAKYKAWLVETGKETPDKVKLSEALTGLIEALTSLRNVYPTGTLHDCEQNDTLEGAIILNNSVLGTF